MKIAYVIPDLTYSGLPRICIDSCNFLCATNEVCLISLCSHNNDLIPLSSIDHRIQLSCLNKKKGFNLRLMLKVFINLRKISPDILHTHKIGLLYSVLYIFTHLRFKVFFTVHSLADKDAPFYYRPFYWCLFKFFKVRVIFISRAVKESFIRFYRLNIGQIIYHGVNTAIHALPNETVSKEVAEYKNPLSTTVFITLARIA